MFEGEKRQLKFREGNEKMEQDHCVFVSDGCGLSFFFKFCLTAGTISDVLISRRKCDTSSTGHLPPYVKGKAYVNPLVYSNGRVPGEGSNQPTDHCGMVRSADKAEEVALQQRVPEAHSILAVHQFPARLRESAGFILTNSQGLFSGWANRTGRVVLLTGINDCRNIRTVIPTPRANFSNYLFELDLIGRYTW
ncbi:unnamed protein product [Nesidiocoris tenuis]|uniref:Uncharacterized protein n=1 Tax=Nesidiocoris tenuis TaxID=355587 RepID=A0A6H5GW54_9HEMI|nr:unnamed protein product [Nesidiocoris tenuis]